MNSKLMIAGLATALTTVFATQAFAQPAPATPNTPRIDKREANQTKRIEQGKASGALNDKEAARLEKGQSNVATAEAKAKEDGVVTKKEKAKIAHKQDVQSKRIAVQKHDKQTKPVTPPAN